MDSCRVEKDALGNINVPLTAYYGSFTTRAKLNFVISDLTPSDYFRKSLAIIKKSALYTNFDLGLIDQKFFDVIDKAINEFLEGKFNAEFNLDYFQAGAGTPFNMNFNEIIANRANELLGSKLGKYEYVHPNNHVNMGQSSNDVIPTAIRISAIMYFNDELLPSIKNLIDVLIAKSSEGIDVIKVGRTHLEDAVPMTVQDEFLAFARNIEKSLKFLSSSVETLFELGLGGTALGSGITSHSKYRDNVIEYLRQFSGLSEIYISDNLFEMSQSCQALGIYSAGLRCLANDLVKISQDLKLLNMGPNSGLSEITLPEVEPGSSIMPGKVNPSVAEAMHMIAVQVIGNDTAVQYGVNSGQLQLNVMTPMILFNLEFSSKILKNGIDMFVNFCVKDIIFNKDRITELVDKSLIYATSLVPYLGYQVVAELVNEALLSKSSITAVTLKYSLVSQELLDKILSPKTLDVDVKLRNEIQNSESYLNYKHLIGK